MILPEVDDQFKSGRFPNQTSNLQKKNKKVMVHDSRLDHPVEMISLDIQVCDFYEFQ